MIYILNMKLGLYQFNPERLNLDANLRKISNAVLSHPQLDIVVFPELATSGYLFKSKNELMDVAVEVPGSPVFERLVSLAGDTDALLVVGLPEKKGDCVYNSAVAFFPDGTFMTYRKLHLFDREKWYFTPGDIGLTTFTFRDAKVGIMICFDWIFPEMARSIALLGVELLLHPANLVLPWGQRAMQIRAIENRIFTATANRIGKESVSGVSLTFTGRSQIVSPDGKVIVSADESSEMVIFADIDTSIARDKKITKNNDIFEDRRPEFYKL